MPSRSVLPALLAFALLAASACTDTPAPSGTTGAQETAAAGTTAVETPILEQAAFDLDDHQGEVVLLNFWATWCAPCRAEMPDLAHLQQELGEEGLQIIGVAMDRGGRSAVTPYLAQRPVNYPIVLDAEGTLAEEYGGVAALPTTFVIGRDGDVRQRIVGRVRADPLRSRLEEVLTEGGAPADSSRSS